ncbi:MAG: c-type cytochrome [Alphaproteobacteria bacterium]|nr:c-type cytochrome [Alphaproteobacteria bacterium]
MNGDPLFLNKVIGSVLTAGLIAMTAGFIAHFSYHPQMLDQPVYAIGGNAPTTKTVTTSGPAGPEPITGLLASADPAKGEKLFKKCAACHSYAKGGPKKVGPNLWNVVGGARGARDGFKYSGTMKGMSGKWTFADLNTFLYKPKMLVKGTKMNFAGFKKAQDRADVIRFLHPKSDSPVKLP